MFIILNEKRNQLFILEKTRIVVSAVLLVFLIMSPFVLAAGGSVDEKSEDVVKHETTVTEIEVESTIDIPEEPTVRKPVIVAEPTTETTECPSEAEIEPETIEQVIEVNEEDVELLAIVIYQEAGSDYISDDVRRMVADVVLNRVEHEYFPDTIYEVITQPYQYGTLAFTGPVWPASAYYSGNAHAVERARRIAREVLSGQHSELYGEGYIWQAEFVQGTGDGFWCSGIYFGRN